MSTYRETTDQRRFTVDEYHRMGDAGVLASDERVELIRGVVRPMSPKKRHHVVATKRILGFMIRSLEGRASVYQEAPLQLQELDSEPEPDLLVCSNLDDMAYGTPAMEPLLVIEVADASLGYDLGAKAALYAEAGIPEYWVVNLVDGVIEVFRQPGEGRFESRRTVRAGEPLAPEAWPDAALELSSLFRDLKS